MQRRRSLLLATTAAVTIGIGAPAKAGTDFFETAKPTERLASIRAAYLHHLRATQDVSATDDVSDVVQTAQFPNFPNFSNWRNR